MSTTSAPRSLSPVPVAAREITLHGRPVAFLEAGADSGGPVVVLLHGLASSSQTWAGVLPLLGRHAHVIAPDLLGHGRSAKPRSGDYSLGAYAAGVRDLLITLGLDRATVAGHSFGGGVAMQFAYQFPELAQRLVLVSSGGLGRAVTVALRAATLPGTSMVLRALPAITPPWLTRLARRMVPALDRPDLVGMATAVASFTDRGARGAFAQTVRGALNLSGQRLEGTERLYLLADVPVLLVGGSEDTVIPVDHTTNAHDLLPGSHLEIFDGAGHFPHPVRRPRDAFPHRHQRGAVGPGLAAPPPAGRAQPCHRRTPPLVCGHPIPWRARSDQ
jgi:pimeloyl-ACP methyl ester carboxylesterase